MPAGTRKADLNRETVQRTQATGGKSNLGGLLMGALKTAVITGGAATAVYAQSKGHTVAAVNTLEATTNLATGSAEAGRSAKENILREHEKRETEHQRIETERRQQQKEERQRQEEYDHRVAQQQREAEQERQRQEEVANGGSSVNRS